jgi:hypothetical protein
MNKSKEKSISYNYTKISSKSKEGNNVNIGKVIDENNQLTAIEKLALRRGIERVNRGRDSQQTKIIRLVNSLDVKQNFQDRNNQLKLQILFNTVLKLKRIYPSKSAMWKAPNNNTLPPYKSVRLENKLLKRGLRKKCSSYPNKEKIIENWYKLMKVQESL